VAAIHVAGVRGEPCGAVRPTHCNAFHPIERKYGSIMNLNGFGKKLSWLNIRHYPGILLNLLKKAIKFSARISSVLANIGT